MCGFNPNKSLFLIPYDNAMLPGYVLDFSFCIKSGKIIYKTNGTKSRKYYKHIATLFQHTLNEQI